MLKLVPILLAVFYAFLMMRFSVWRTKRMLDEKSRPLDDPEIAGLAAQL